MEFCKNCRNLPICSYSENEYILPDVFDITCSFYQPLCEALISSQNNETEQTDDSIGQNENVAEIEENSHEKIEETIEELKAELDEPAPEPVNDELPDLDEGAGKYPAKKGRKPSVTPEQREQILEMYKTTKPDKIAAALGIGKSTVYKIIKEDLKLG